MKVPENSRFSTRVRELGLNPAIVWSLYRPAGAEHSQPMATPWESPNRGSEPCKGAHTDAAIAIERTL
jgi:hypothetical protein